MSKIFKHFLFPTLLFLLVLVLFYFNYLPETFLTGWDNLQVELGFSINLERSLNVAWQEYQGLGLLGGMGHGADLLRQLFLSFFSLFLKQNFLRYFWNLICLLLGTLTFYQFLAYLLKNKKSKFWQFAAFLGSAFYLLNLGTVQNFYPSYDPFSAFFAFLPVLLLFIFKYLDKHQKKDLIIFAVLSLLATTFSYVQTIFVVYFLLISIILLYYYFSSKNLSRSVRIKSIFEILLVIILTNAFWLLPVLYFTITSSSTTLMAKGNLMATDVTFLRNLKYGNFFDILTLKGFWLDYSDFDSSGNAIYLMDAWKIHLNNPLFKLASYSFLFFMFLGILSLFLGKKKKWNLVFLFLFCFSLFILLGSNPPFAFIFNFLKDYLPLFGQIFRSAFTKWVVPFSLFYSVLFAFGLNFLFSFFKKKLLKIFTSLLVFMALIFYSWPSFQGHYFYQNLRVKIPAAYFQLFDYFENDVPAAARIANLPQHSFYGWQWNDWGYRGSGFLWYGIKQPILDRAFDVWSQADEGYYWQLQYALDLQDIDLFEEVLKQYDVDYLLLDQSVLNRNSAEPFDYQVWQDFLEQSDLISLQQDFDFIKVYSFADDENSREKEFLSLYENLPELSNDFDFLYYDQAFLDQGDYLLSDQADLIYPFASLFTNHSQEELEFSLSEDLDYFYLYSQNNFYQKSRENLNLLVEDYLNQETYLPVRISWETQEEKTEFLIEALLPEIYLNKNLYTWDFKYNLSLNSSSCQDDCQILINNQSQAAFSSQEEVYALLSTKRENTIALTGPDKLDYRDYWLLDLSSLELQQKVQELENQTSFHVKIPKFNTQSLGENLLFTEANKNSARNCDAFLQGSFSKLISNDINTYQSQGAKSCDSFYVEDLDHRQSYLIKARTKNLSSLPFLFAVQSASLARSPIETYLAKSNDWADNYLFLPATESFNQGYSFYFSTDSYGREKNENQLEQLIVYYFPFDFVKNIKLGTADFSNHEESNLSDCQFSVIHKNLWSYQLLIESDSCQAEQLTIKLSQAYSDDWLAISKMGILSHQAFSHWANAWNLDLREVEGDLTVTIFFWPQLLEYLGFGFLAALIIYLVFKNRA